MRKYPAFILLFLVLTACTGSRSGSGNGGAEWIEFNILQLNDVYNISPLDGDRFGGMARVGTIRNSLLEANPNLITVLDGDYLSPSLIGSLKCTFDGDKDRVNGRQMVDVMNALGVDYVTFGNHEFDLKEKDVIARTQESEFKIISANCLHVKDGEQVPFQQNGKDIPRYLVHEFKGGMKLGLIGVTLPFNTQDYVHYLPHYETARQAYEDAKQESDVVMAISHLTMEMDDTLARKVPEMPLIMGGHEHYNQFKQVGKVAIAKADGNAKTVYIHWCKYNPATQETKIYSQLMPVTNAFPADPEVDKVVQKWEDFANACMEEQGYQPEEKIGFSAVPLDGREGSLRFGQTNLGGLVADAMRDCNDYAEIALLNSGSIRIDDELVGNIQQRDILGTLPFGGGIKVGTISGSQLRRLLDDGLSDGIKGNGAYLQLSTNIKAEGSNYQVNGQALSDGNSYKVAIPGFVAGGGEKSLGYIKDFTDWQDPTLKQGVAQNDVRDIVIWAMKNAE